MDVPDSRLEYLRPSVAGPKVPEFSRLRKTQNLDMNSALAWLRRELAAMQIQDRKLHKQLLAMQSSISDLKDELQSDRERWELENHPDERPGLQSPAPAYVTKVEIFDSDREHLSPELGINHAKQDSGILTDEDGSDKEEESTQQMLQTYPPSKARSNSFSSPGHYRIKSDEGFDEDAKRRPRHVIRTRAQSVTGLENERISSVVNIPARARSQTVAEGTVTRFNSMPVINEIPGDSISLRGNAPRTKAFAVYGCRRSTSRESVVECDDKKTAYSVPKKLPVAFGTLTRHSSMPVMYSRSRRTGVEFDSTKENLRLVNTQPIRRTTSQLVLSKPAWDRTRETGTNQMRPYRIYRSVSQISLV